MQINSISNSNFTGLWIQKGSKKAGEKDGVKLVNDKYIYRPFADENKNATKAAVSKLNGKEIHEFYNDSDYPSVIHNVSVKVGTPLNISAAEYEKAISPMACDSVFDTKEIVG